VGEPFDRPAPPPPRPPPWLFKVSSCQNDEVYGGAALVAPTLALTSAHVVNQALGRTSYQPDLPSTTVWLADTAPQAKALPTTVAAEYWFPGEAAQDLALLRIPGDGVTGPPLPRLRPLATVPDGETLWSWGFPAVHTSEVLELEASGRRQFAYAVALRVRQGTPNTGFSGCPVFTGDGALVGVITRFARRERSGSVRDDEVFAVPVEHMFGHWPGEPGEAAPGVGLPRLLGAELTDRDTCERLYDTLTSVPLADLGTLWSEDRRVGTEPEPPDVTAWDHLTTVWNRLSRPGRTSPRRLWVYHVYRHLEATRSQAVPTALWSWLAERATHEVAHGALQVFGGVAFTAEHPAHRFLRRIAARGNQFGTAREHERALGRSLALEMEVLA
jgi:hypothetical protein